MFIYLQRFKNYKNDIIYKNKDYIIKHEIDEEKYYEYVEDLNIYESIEIIYLIVEKFGKKYYTNNNRVNLIKSICDKCNIEYKILPNGIEMFVIIKLEYIKDREYEGKMVFLDNSLLFIKIKGYVLFV